MTFKEVCNRYHLTANLVEHLLSVATLCAIFCNNWNGREKLDKEEIIKMGLLHDLGNMAKSTPESLPKYLNNATDAELDYWGKEILKFHDKYGTSSHIATKVILEELNVSKDITTAIDNKTFDNILTVVELKHWPTKILSYADLRVNPGGISSLEDRLAYIKERYPKYSTRPDFEEMCNAARRLEDDIQNNLSINARNISQKEISQEQLGLKLEAVLI